MRSRLAVHTAFGAALALALTLTSTVAPTFAATPMSSSDIIPSAPLESPSNGVKTRPGISPSNPIVVQPGTVLPQPAPETSPVTFKPDIRVNYLGQSSAGGGKVAYRFRVQNIGAASASNIGLGTTIGQDANNGWVSTRQEGNGGTIASLGQDQAQEVTVTCTPLAGYHCDGARLTAYVDDDLNESNNTAHSS